MRRDMHKVVTESPRAGGGSATCYLKKARGQERRLFKNTPVDLAHKKESMKKRYKSRKEFTDNLAPLKRYLRSQCGRPWDKVWSDISKVFKGTGTQAQHIKNHIKSMDVHTD